MKLNKIAGAVITATALFSVSSATFAESWVIDYRHRFEDQSKHHYDRIMVNGNFDNGVGFYIDTSYKSGSTSDGFNNDPDQWGDFTSNAVESSIWWNYKVDGTGFVIQPGIIFESTSETTGYKPYVRLQYNTDMGLWFALRARFDYWRYDQNAPEGDNYGDQKTGRFDAFIGYKYGNWDFMYQGTYMWALNDLPNGDDRVMWDNETYNFEHEFTVGYKWGNWRPYLQIANLAGAGNHGKIDGDRQTRWALGVSYTF